MFKTNNVKQVTCDRLLGVDVARVIAAFGVVAIHAGLVVDGRLTATAPSISSFFTFVVPFFVVTSLALTVRGASLPWKEWLIKNVRRLILPYLVWAALYLFLRLVRYKSNPSLVLNDPVALLLFNGGGALALYFIPMLWVGLLLTRLLRPVIDKIRVNLLFILVLTFFSYALLEIMLVTGNAYDLTFSKGFLSSFPDQENLFLRIALVVLAHALFCLPHLFAALFGWCLFQAKRINVLIIVGGLFFVMPFFVTYEWKVLAHLRGDGAFLFALGISPLLSHHFVDHKLLISRVAAYSFGVYLSHQVILQGLQVLCRKFIPATFFMGPTLVLVQTLLVFLVLCFVIYQLSSRSVFFTWLFAVR